MQTRSAGITGLEKENDEVPIEREVRLETRTVYHIRGLNEIMYVARLGRQQAG